MTDEIAGAAGHRRRRRHRHSRASKQVRVLSRHLRRQLGKRTPGATVELAPLAVQAHKTLKQMRRDVLRRGGAGAGAAAAGLQQADRSLAKLVAANAASTPEEAAKLLGEGAAALAHARSNAKKAGDAWPA